jgi:hypothetical protein
VYFGRKVQNLRALLAFDVVRLPLPWVVLAPCQITPDDGPSGNQKISSWPMDNESKRLKVSYKEQINP